MMKDEGALWTKISVLGTVYNGLEIYLSNKMSMIERVLEDSR